jgi:arylsulfatase
MVKKDGVTRKEALKKLGSLALFPAAASIPVGEERNVDQSVSNRNTSSQKGPNILFLMDDQHRGDFLGAAGAHWIKTPNLDQLAKEGATFTNAYCAVPSCTPARTSLLTGLSPWSHGMLGYMNSIAQYYKITLPQFFSEMGYYTMVVGKNHFGPPRNTNGYVTAKLEEGFYSVREEGFVCDYQSWFKREAPDLEINATGLGYNDNKGGIPFPFKDELHATHWTAETAIEFLQTSRQVGPWFMKVSFQRPHPPFDPPKRWMDYYQNVNVPMPAVGEWANEKYKGKYSSMDKTPATSSGIFPKDEVKASREAYAGAISFVDEQIGRIIKELKRLGQYENTLIMFVSDHGEMLGDQHMWRKCRPYQPSVNVPMILRWPKMPGFDIRRGQVRNELVELRDIFPTLADACSFKIPDGLDGKSILKLLKENESWRKTLCLEHSQIYEADNAWIAITDGRHKYIFFTLDGVEQLFDLKTDPTETTNIVHSPGTTEVYHNLYAELVKEMSVRGEAWVKEGKLQIQKTSILIGDKFPKSKTNQLF